MFHVRKANIGILLAYIHGERVIFILKFFLVEGGGWLKKKIWYFQ